MVCGWYVDGMWMSSNKFSVQLTSSVWDVDQLRLPVRRVMAFCVPSFGAALVDGLIQVASSIGATVLLVLHSFPALHNGQVLHSTNRRWRRVCHKLPPPSPCPYQTPPVCHRLLSSVVDPPLFLFAG